MKLQQFSSPPPLSASLSHMDISHITLLSLASILAIILLCTLFKGVIKVLIVVLAIISATATWLFLQRNGLSFVSLLINEPSPWMVDALSWGMSIIILIVFFHGLSWFSMLFTWNKKKMGVTGFITTILMSLVMLWTLFIGLSYASNISRIGYYHELALAQSQKQAIPSLPPLTQLNQRIWEFSDLINPIEDRALTNLACLIAYGATLEEHAYREFYNERLAHQELPYPSRFLKFFADPGIRKMIKDGHFIQLMENEQLKTFLLLGKSNEAMRAMLP